MMSLLFTDYVVTLRNLKHTLNHAYWQHNRLTQWCANSATSSRPTYQSKQNNKKEDYIQVDISVTTGLFTKLNSHKSLSGT